MITRRAPARRRVDTSRVEARLRAEAAEVAKICREECDLGHLAEASFWAGYLTALYHLCGNDAALIELTLIEEAGR